MKEKTEWKPKLDFSSEYGLIIAGAILEQEGFDVRGIFHPGELAQHPTILFDSSKKKALKAFHFVMDQGWPVIYLSKIWRRPDDNGDYDTHWQLEFAEIKSS